MNEVSRYRMRVLAIVGLSLLSLLLINAQAVTSLTSERDGKTLDLLLARRVEQSTQCSPGSG